ncbi:argininosuccinate lyase [Candidatus Bipolaricaulota sp. J31]
MTLWKGRLPDTAPEVRLLCDSLESDRRLYAADIRGSIAYARALGRAGVLTAEEVDALVRGLERIAVEFKAGAFVAAPDDEDVHTAVERRLTELLGEELAGKLHTGRSRNDQVATDLRLWLLGEIPGIRQGLLALGEAIVAVAEAHIDLIMPGYTHLRRAQPVLFSHWLLSHFWRIARDLERLDALARRVAVMPLGAGALAGNPFGVDRGFLAAELGFSGPAENSLDAVSDRDFVAEFLFFAALCGVHLSQLSEDLIVFSSPEFGFLELDERYLTGSSLMPQKANPDPLELARGRAGTLIGTLCGFLAVLKGLPSGYNRDLQEDKEALFTAVDSLRLMLPVFAGIVRTMAVRPERMAAALEEEMLATELADHLVERGVPFREAHRAVGRLVRRARELGVPLGELPLEEYREIHPAFGDDVREVLDFRRAVGRRRSHGGTAPERVREQIALAKEMLAERRKDGE